MDWDTADSVEYGSVEDDPSQLCDEELPSNELEEAADFCLEIAESCVQPLLEGWAFSITGDLLIDRAPLVAMIRKLGAKCGDKGEFYKRESHCYGPTNALIISEEELQGILAGKIATKKLKEAVAAQGAGRPIAIVPEMHLYELICKEKSIPRDGFDECDIAAAVRSIVSNQ